MTSYYSALFFTAFLPITVMLYGMAPRRFRWAVLLLASYGFFFALSGALIAFVALSTAVVYACARMMGANLAEKNRQLATASSGKREIREACKRKNRRIVFAAVVANIGILAVLKYSGFFGLSLASALAAFGISIDLSIPSFALPIGISFYTLMAVSYVVDVYRERTKADKNLGHVALFLAFFPGIMEGPLSRYNDVAPSLIAGEPLNRKNLYAGTLRIMWGMAKKIIVADRLNAFVKPVFDNYGSYDGGVIALAAILYTIQLYCDFSGTMDVALGMGPRVQRNAARKLQAAVLLPHRLRILATLAYHAGPVVQRLRVLPYLVVQAMQDADDQGAQAFRKQIRSASGKLRCAVLRVDRQRLVAWRPAASTSSSVCTTSS